MQPSDPPSRRPGVWQLAWPAVLTNLLQSTVGFVDIKAVGTLGSNAVAAATAGHRLFFALQAVLMAVYDNLGKGASGAAVQNLNLMLGVAADTSLAA